MDAVPILFLLAMVLVGGLVAFYGDKIGMAIGKKKIKAWKLRPRQVASLVTFLAGALGTALTIGALFLLSQPVRSWITERKITEEKLATTKADLSNAQLSVQETRNRLKLVEGERQALTTDIQRKNQELKDAQIEQMTLNSKNKELDRKGKDLLKKFSRLTGELKSVNSELKTTQSEKLKVEAEIKKSLTQQGVLTNNNQAIQERNLELTREALELEKKAEALQKQIGQITEEYNALIQASNEADAKFNSQLETYRQELKKAETELSKTLADLQRSRNAMEAAAQGETGANLKLKYTLNNALIFPIGAEVYRAVLPANMSLGDSLRAVEGFKRQLREAARQAGAKEDIDGRIADLLPDYTHPKPISPQDQWEALANGIAGHPVESLVVATAKLNSFEGDFVPIEIHVFENLKVYDQGDLVVSLQIDGRKSVPDIVAQIAAQISKELPKTLSQKKMIPVVGSDQPYGSLDTDRIIAIALEIKEAGIPLRLQLMAAKETYRADRIQFTYRLRP